MNRASVRRELSLPEAARVVLFVGQLVPIKRLDLLLAAWRGLLRDARIGRDDRLLLIGEGPLRAPLELQASADDFGGSVCFLGGRPQVEVARWVSAADLLCLPSDNEGTPNVIVEALASGRPVVATAVGGIPELVIPNVNGVLVLPGDAPGLQAGLAAALVQKWDAAQIAATVSGYTWQALAQSNFALLTRVVAESSQVKHAPD
jgi:glycosyltransferase involved in cell wall biosynthesis